MDSIDKRAASAACKERKNAAGIYAVQCAASGDTWVGRAPSIGAIRNRLWFTLRQGSHPNRALQAAWTAHGEDAFSLEVLDQSDEEDETAYVRDRWLKERLAHWLAETKAARL